MTLPKSSPAARSVVGAGDGDKEKTSLIFCFAHLEGWLSDEFPVKFDLCRPGQDHYREDQSAFLKFKPCPNAVKVSSCQTFQWSRCQQWPFPVIKPLLSDSPAKALTNWAAALTSSPSQSPLPEPYLHRRCIRAYRSHRVRSNARTSHQIHVDRVQRLGHDQASAEPAQPPAV